MSVIYGKVALDNYIKLMRIVMAAFCPTATKNKPSGASFVHAITSCWCDHQLANLYNRCNVVHLKKKYLYFDKNISLTKLYRNLMLSTQLKQVSTIWFSYFYRNEWKPGKTEQNCTACFWTFRDDLTHSCHTDAVISCHWYSHINSLLNWKQMSTGNNKLCSSRKTEICIGTHNLYARDWILGSDAFEWAMVACRESKRKVNPRFHRLSSDEDFAFSKMHPHS